MENLILLLFLALPPALFVVAAEVIRRARQSGRERQLRTLVAGNVLILLLLLSVAMLVGECYYRFVYDQTDSFGLCKTTARWFDRHYHRNLTGFRDSINYLPMIEPGRRRVSFVGDSFTAGHGIKDVEDRFANRIRAARPDLEVHVLSMCGLDTGRELELIEYLPKTGYETDIVVLAYCLNDISDIAPAWKRVEERIYKASPPGFFVTHSYLFNTLHARWRMAREPEIANYYDFIQDAYQGPVWEQHEKRLGRLQEAVSAQGGSLLVVTFPFLHALGDDYAYRQVHRQLDDFWSGRNVPHLDLLPVFADERPDRVVISSRDVHPNEHAHALAAEAIGCFLDAHLQPAEVSSGG